MAPNFAFCHNDYGVGLRELDALYAASKLPSGAGPVRYTNSDDSPPRGAAAFFHLPLIISERGVSVSIEVASPVDLDSITLRPDNLRGMAGYLASHCLGTRGQGGWITSGI